jgi:hypothetical protein
VGNPDSESSEFEKMLTWQPDLGFEKQPAQAFDASDLKVFPRTKTLPLLVFASPS